VCTALYMWLVDANLHTSAHYTHTYMLYAVLLQHTPSHVPHTLIPCIPSHTLDKC
jgi:hypothetical protein